MKRYVGKVLILMAIAFEFSCNAASGSPLAFAAVAASAAAAAGVTAQQGGTITVTVSGGVPPYTFTLSGSPSLPPQIDPTAIFTNVAATDQEVIVTDSAVPQNLIRMDIVISATPVISTNPMVSGIILKQPSCLNGTDGSLQFTAIANGTVTFSLSNSVKTFPPQVGNGTFTGLAADPAYTILVSAAGTVNPGEADFPLAQPLTALALTTSATAPTCANGSNGTITALVGGGIAPYTVTLNTGQSISTPPFVFTGLTSGAYTVKVTDSNGCSLSLPQTVQSSPNPALVMTTKITPQDIVNGTLGSIVATVTGGTPPYTVTLTPGGQPAQTGTSGQAFTFSNLVANTYTIHVVDATGCAVSDPAVVPCTRGTSTNPITNFITTALCKGGCTIPA